MFDELVRSRHSRLSGIVVLYNVLKRNDSGQAGMTSKEGFSTFYETVTFCRDRVLHDTQRQKGGAIIMDGIYFVILGLVAVAIFAAIVTYRDEHQKKTR